MATKNTETHGGLPSVVVEDLLSVENRRRALEILAERDEPMVVEELAATVVAARERCDPAAVSASEQSAMADELFTEHIPKLTATGVLRYDSMLGSVELLRDDIVESGRT